MGGQLTKKKARIFVLAFGLATLLCFAMSGGFFWFQYRVKSWPTVDGRVMSTEITESWSSTDDGDSILMFNAHVNYTYFVDGQEFSNDDIWPMGYSSSDKDEVEDSIKEYSTGQIVAVRYNTSSPDDSCLKSEVSWLTLIPFIIGFVFMIPTAVMSFFALR